MTEARMRAARVDEHGNLRIEEVPRSECAPGQIRIRIEACGVCGSDLHAAQNKSWDIGRIPGHEIAGRIEAIGKNPPAVVAARGLHLGQQVVAEPLESCRICRPCNEGRDSICPELQIAGVHRDGGFAESISLPAERIYPLSEPMPPEVAALCEPLAVGIHAVGRGKLAQGERVLVLGGGTLGLLCAFSALHSGAGEVVLRARYPHQRVLAEDAIGVTASDSARAILDSTLDSEFDLVLETVGGESETLIEAAQASRPGGRIVVLGLFQPSPHFSPELSLQKELSYHWSNCYGKPEGQPADFERAIQLLSIHHHRLRHTVTQTIPLNEIQQAFDLAKSKHEGAGKVSVLAV